MSHNGLRLAIGTLTVLRTPAPTVVDRAVAGRAMLLAPVAALVPATAALVVLLVGWWATAPPLATAAVAVGALALASRGLHLDGLADTADGLASGYDRERALAVMRTGDVGPAGATTLLVVVLAQSAAVVSLAAGWRGALVVAAAIVSSRGVLSVCCAAPVPSARAEGLGATVAGTVPVPWALAATAASASGLGVVAAAAGLPWWAGPLAALLGLGAAGVLLRRCVRRLGGVSGDVLGACVEIALTTSLVVLATVA